MAAPGLYFRHDLPGVGRHQVLECHHDGAKPPGNLVIGSRQTVRARLLGIEFFDQPVAVLGKKANLIAQASERNAVFGFGKGLPQEGLELLDSHIEPLGSPLQGVGLAHRCTLPAEAPRSLSAPSGCWTCGLMSMSRRAELIQPTMRAVVLFRPLTLTALRAP